LVYLHQINTPEEVQKIESHLKNNVYLSGGDEPNIVDATVVKQIREKKFVPSYIDNPSLFGYCNHVANFSDSALE
jgi:hypothetical protein